MRSLARCWPLLAASTVLCSIVPLLLAGCGGGLSGKTVAAHRASGVVQIPAGSGMLMHELTVISCTGRATPASNGAFTVDEPATGPALVALLDKGGNMSLIGYFDAGDPTLGGELSALSTATALLFQQLGIYTLPSSAWKDALALLSADARTAQLAAVIAQRVAADSAALQNEDAQIRAAVLAAAGSMVPAGSASRAAHAPADRGALAPTTRLTLSRAPAAITVTSANPQSGVQVGANPDGDGIVLVNSYRRHVWYWVYRSGYQDENGQDVTLDPKEWVEVANGYLGSTNGLAGALGSALDSIWGNVAYKAVTSPVIDIDFVPSSAKRVYLTVVTAGAGSRRIGLPDELVGNPHEGAWDTGRAGMQAITFVKDFLLPTFFTFVPADAVNRMTGRQLTDFAFGMIGLCTQSGFDAATAIAANDWWGALKTVGKGIGTDSGLREKLAIYVGTKLALTDVSVEALGRMAGFAKLLNSALKLTDIGYFAIDLGAVIHDSDQSNVYDRFTVTAAPPKARIEPDPATVHPAMYVDLTVYKDINTPGTFTYKYKIRGEHGWLSIVGTDMSGVELGVQHNSVRYNCRPDAKVGDTEKLTVEVGRWVTTDAGTKNVVIAHAETTVTVTAAKVTIDPVAATLHAGQSQVFGARIDDKTITDDSLTYHWTNTAKGGHIQTGGLVGDDYENSQPETTYVAGSEDADDTVTLQIVKLVDGERYTIGTGTASVQVQAAPVLTATPRYYFSAVPVSGEPGKFDIVSYALLVWKKPATDYPYWKGTLHTAGNEHPYDEKDRWAGWVEGRTTLYRRTHSGGDPVAMDRGQLTSTQGVKRLGDALADDELCVIVTGLHWMNFSQSTVDQLAAMHERWKQYSAGWSMEVRAQTAP